MKKGTPSVFKKGSPKRKVMIGLLFLVIILAILLGIYQFKKQKLADQKTTDKIETIKRRTIVNSVSGTGTVVSKNDESVTADMTGMEIKEVLVKTGDTVQAGDTLFVFDTSALTKQRDADMEQVNSLTEEKAKRQKDSETSSAASEAERQTQMASTKQSIAETTTEYETAQADLASTEQTYNQLVASGTSPASLQATQLQTVIEAKKTNVSTLKTRLDTENDTLLSLQNTDTAATAAATLQQYNQTTDATIQTLNSQIQTLDQQISKGTIKASIAGTVTSVSAREHTTYTGGTLAEIEGTDSFLIEAKVDEYDIADVAVNMPVRIKTDATRNTEMNGTVTYVAVKATEDNSSLSSLSGSLSGVNLDSLSGSTSSAPSYLVRIAITDQNSRLRLGMNAKISIITASKENVLSVPYEAIQKHKDGTNYIQLVKTVKNKAKKNKAGKYSTQEQTVTTGLEGTYYTEIASEDVKEGMKVLVPGTDSSSSVEDLLNMMGSDAGVSN